MKGSIEKRGENSYRLIVSGGFDGSGKRIKKTRLFKADPGMTDAAKQEVAETALALFIADIEKGDAAQSKGMTLSDLWEYWKTHYANGSLEQTTLVYYENMFPRIKQALGNKRIDRIEPKHIQSFLTNLAEPGIKKVPVKKEVVKTESPVQESAPPPVEKIKSKNEPPKLSPVTIRKYHAVLSGLFNHAVKWNLMNYNPSSRVDPPKIKRTQDKEMYDLDTTGRLLDALEGEETRHKLMVMLALTTGLRNEELFGLRWSDISGNTIRVQETRVYLGKGIGTITKATKTASSDRAVSMPPEVVSLMSKHSAKEAAKRLKCGDRWKGSDRIFTTWDGSDMFVQAFRLFLGRFTQKHGLPKISPHDFRHMAASFLIASGTDIKTVSGKLGHSRTSTTVNTYAHLLKSAESETANTMTTILATIRKQTNDIKKSEPA